MTGKQSKVNRSEQERPETTGETPAASPEVAEEQTSQEQSGQAEEAGSESILDQLTATKAERDEFQDQFLRARADLENFRKRVHREREEERRYAAAGLIQDLLPAMDNLRRALDAGRAADAGGEALLQGVRMVLTQFEEILSRHGAEPIPAEGEKFDPNVHEAIQQIPTDEHPPLTVIQELQQGFKLHDRVLRPSKVVVSSAPAAADAEDASQS
jgi:molecular chaperone GrpE